MTILYRDTHDVDFDQLATLFDAVGWQHRTADRARMAQMVHGSRWVVSAWAGDRLVGFARAISDGATNAYISTVAVLPEFQRRGIGRELLRRLLEGRDGIQFVLHANDRAYPFYLHIGLDFQPYDNVLVRPRKF